MAASGDFLMAVDSCFGASGMGNSDGVGAPRGPSAPGTRSAVHETPPIVMLDAKPTYLSRIEEYDRMSWAAAIAMSASGIQSDTNPLLPSAL